LVTLNRRKPNPPTDVARTTERARETSARGEADEMTCRQALAVWPGQTDATHLLGLIGGV
jgi:hypothetical protein